uniref:G-protein coupled receptors family 1 profile domain-containing protein n=1 Tax=Ascaris lumbricoides TaxID=6252 RepID=A0A9J2P238_ASCLU
MSKRRKEISFFQDNTASDSSSYQMASINFLTAINASECFSVSGFTVVVNLSLAAAIFFSKYAHIAQSGRAYVLIVGTLITDTIFNLAYLFSSIITIVMEERPSRLSCSIQAFPCTFYILGTPLIGFSIALVAFDRFYAVISPARYFKSEAKQAWFGVAGILGVAFVVLLMFIIFMAMNNAQCLIGFVGLAGVMFILRYLRMASIGTAIAFYIATYAYVKSNHEKVSKQLGHQHAMNRMMSILKTAVIAILPAVVFIFIPDICFSFGALLNYTDYLNTMIMFKGAINAFIYLLRHRDLRKCVCSRDTVKISRHKIMKVSVSGCTATINLALTALIFSSKHSSVARCERTYVLIFGSLIMDTTLSLAYLFSSIVLIITEEKMSRLNLPTNSYFNGGRSIFLFLFAERPSRLSCTIQTFSCVFFMLGTPLVGFSVILVAYDRLYAVIKPAIYYKSGAKQAWIGVTVSFGIAFAILLVFIAIKATRHSACILDFQGLSALMPVLRCMRLLTIVLAITFYVAAYAYVRSNRDKLAKQLSQKHAMNRMMSLLKTSATPEWWKLFGAIMLPHKLGDPDNAAPANPLLGSAPKLEAKPLLHITSL